MMKFLDGSYMQRYAFYKSTFYLLTYLLTYQGRSDQFFVVIRSDFFVDSRSLSRSFFYARQQVYC